MSLICIIGAGGHARVIADAISTAGTHEITGFLDNVNPQRIGDAFCGGTILGGLEQLCVLRRKNVEWSFVAVGDQNARVELGQQALEAGFRLATIVHPSATIAATAAVGAGTFVAAGAIVGPSTCIGDHVIVNHRVSVDHDCEIGEGVHLSPGVVMGGWCRVERGSFVGLGAMLRDRVVVAQNAVVGMGAVVVRDVPSGATVIGTPARVVDAQQA